MTPLLYAGFLAEAGLQLADGIVAVIGKITRREHLLRAFIPKVVGIEEISIRIR